jgi:hypothetical protein
MAGLIFQVYLSTALLRAYLIAWPAELAAGWCTLALTRGPPRSWQGLGDSIRVARSARFAPGQYLLPAASLYKRIRPCLASAHTVGAVAPSVYGSIPIPGAGNLHGSAARPASTRWIDLQLR